MPAGGTLREFGDEARGSLGALAAQSVVPLVHVLVGALDESALYIAQAEDPPAAREECTEILDRLLRGFMASP